MNIENRILKTENVKWKELLPIQGKNFKELSEASYLKLKHSMKENQFIAPFAVWQAKDGKIYTLDGVHRCRVLLDLENEGISVPVILPANFIDAKDRKEAAKLLLVYSSAYAKVTDEGLIDRYENIALAGFNYHFLGNNSPSSASQPLFYLNDRIYSCISIKNSIPYRWRGKYNEDTDLSLRVLKDGYCTILFNTFLCEKVATMNMKGGNTDELYKKDDKFDGLLEMAKSLQRQHPDVAKITRKWGRWQHQVDYRPFKNNKLRLKKNIVIPQGINNYGMKLVKNSEQIS
jgi:hypothetical protein